MTCPGSTGRMSDKAMARPHGEASATLLAPTSSLPKDRASAGIDWRRGRVVLAHAFAAEAAPLSLSQTILDNLTTGPVGTE